MPYSLFKLNFQSGLHVGASGGGPSLDHGKMVIHGDTLFSALYLEMLKTGEQDQLWTCFAKGGLTLSDALPFHQDSYYLPKPLLYIPSLRHKGDSVQSKALKDLQFIAAADLPDYVQGLAEGTLQLNRWNTPVFGVMSVQTRVAIRGNDQPLPYSVAVWSFAPDCGLYIIVRYEEEVHLALLKKALTRLGLSGIGGKTSSGLGRFQLIETQIPNDVLALLDNEQASYQMLLGPGLPADEELDPVLDGGWYTLVRRGGFASTPFMTGSPRRKRTLYMLASGSCLRRRFQGHMRNIAWDGAEHPVWRCSSTLFVGVNLP